jgi:hypothetical protein
VCKRFLKVVGDALEDHEPLELALQLIISRRDTKAMAKTLLREFDSFSGVFDASEACPTQIKGPGETTIAHSKVIQSVAAVATGSTRSSRSSQAGPSSSTIAAAVESIEQFRILFLEEELAGRRRSAAPATAGNLREARGDEEMRPLRHQALHSNGIQACHRVLYGRAFGNRLQQRGDDGRHVQCADDGSTHDARPGSDGKPLHAG